MPDALVLSAPGNLSAPLPNTPRRLHAFPIVAPTRRWVVSQSQVAIGANLASVASVDGASPFTQPTAANQPTLERTNNIYGAKFDATDDIMGTPGGTITDAAYTIIAIVRATPVTNGKAMLNFRGNFFGLTGAGILRLRGTADVTPPGQSAINTGWHFVACVINGANSICRLDSATATGDPGVQTTTTTLATAGGPSFSFAEIAHFNSALTDAQLQSIRTELKKVYTTLP